ncbi:[FeFe] hydrogenase H-cluster radical SAM maturase HydE [Endomicrobium proavitum]|uniref:Radical SAM domain protein n=1 Tax=Endomicrobium proavitum TaxID=1408281 RepID=A0A0G3WIB3_9BACT|nr:[FeFe] hydrogenase H-cluster radical SAM maturase HydE [Endomicrobium proavitum]AKL97607.1 Radical SAM domain protein [Endomicrobium proavitum]
MIFEEILNKVLKTNSLTENEILELLKTDKPQKLFAAADKVRKKNVGDEVHLRALIEFSNICKQNCLYCGLRRDNKKVDRYRLEPETIIDLAKKAKSYGYQTVVLQSGEDPYYTSDIMSQIISAIKKFDIAVTLSIGEKTFEEYKVYKDAGADRYLLRIETTDKDLYEKLDPQMSLENRKECIQNIKKLGYETGSGIIVGLPGQTLESIAKDILYLKSIPVDMAGIGPFILNPNTPLNDKVKSEKLKVELTANDQNNFELALKVMAILRLLMPDINIPATTAMETLNPDGRMIALQSGANVVMPNATEGEYRKLYELYPGKICVTDTPYKCRFCIESKINSIGRSISQGKGNSKSKEIL